MNFFLIKLTDKAQLRNRLRKFPHLKTSSIFYFANDKYVVVYRDIEPRFTATNLELDGYTSLDKSQIVGAKHSMFKWGQSEILDNVEFIGYESQSSYHKNGRVISFDHQEIIRSNEQLVTFMAILNYTDDSFSDGGKYNQIDRALNQIICQLELGAEIIDIGAQSTNPIKSKVLDASDEIDTLSQLLGEVIKLKHKYNFRLSIDTYHEKSVRFCLDNFAIDMINDVSAQLPLKLVQEIVSSNKKYVMMHSLSIPADLNHIIDLNHDPLNIIIDFFKLRIRQMQEMGVNLNGVICDPGIGFGNNEAQAWYILRHIHELYDLGCEILLGHSRKRFMRHLGKFEPQDREEITNIISSLMQNKVDYLRIHDMSKVREFCIAYMLK